MKSHQSLRAAAFFVAAMAFSLISSNFAEAASMSRGAARIFRGDFVVQADSSISVDIPDETDSGFRISGGLEYFVRDFISVGGSLLVEDSGGVDQFRFGPSATWRFLNSDQISVGANTSLLFVNVERGTNDANFINWNLGVGADYFIVPSISVGPAMNLGFLFGDDDEVADSFVFSVLGFFKLYF